MSNQLTHITKEKDCLGKDDRVDCVAGGVAVFAEMLGVDPTVMGARASEDRKAAELAALFEEEDELFGSGRAGGTGRLAVDTRVQAAKPTARH